MLLEFLNRRNSRQRKLTEGIAHLESLPVNDFIDAVSNLSKYVATEKLDGYNLWFGIDDEGFFTSRGGKGGAKFRSGDDFSSRPASNAFRSVHVALESVTSKFDGILTPTDVVEIEVMYGRQPNAIVYGDNMIALLRVVDVPVDQSDVTINKLYKALNGLSITSTTEFLTTDDGISLEPEMRTTTWRVVMPTAIPSDAAAHIDTDKLLAPIRAYLQQQNSVVQNLTNGEVANINLRTVPADVRQEYRAARDEVMDVIDNDLKPKIKDYLVDALLASTTTQLQTDSTKDDPKLGIEGIVFVDPTTRDQFKLVNKDLFTTVNKFNFAVRSAIKHTSPATNQWMTKLGMGETSIFDSLSIQLGTIFGISNNLKYYAVKRVISKYGSTPQEIVNAIASNVRDFEAARAQVVRAIQSASTDLATLRKQFAANHKRFKLRLPTGQVIGYSQEVVNRTLLSFAEANEDLQEILAQVQKARTTEELVSTVFSAQLARIG